MGDALRLRPLATKSRTRWQSHPNRREDGALATARVAFLAAWGTDENGKEIAGAPRGAGDRHRFKKRGRRYATQGCRIAAGPYSARGIIRGRLDPHMLADPGHCRAVSLIKVMSTGARLLHCWLRPHPACGDPDSVSAAAAKWRSNAVRQRTGRMAAAYVRIAQDLPPLLADLRDPPRYPSFAPALHLDRLLREICNSRVRNPAPLRIRGPFRRYAETRR
jgi:hypothetical protein